MAFIRLRRYILTPEGKKEEPDTGNGLFAICARAESSRQKYLARYADTPAIALGRRHIRSDYRACVIYAGIRNWKMTRRTLARGEEPLEESRHVFILFLEDPACSTRDAICSEWASSRACLLTVNHRLMKVTRASRTMKVTVYLRLYARTRKVERASRTGSAQPPAINCGVASVDNALSFPLVHESNSFVDQLLQKLKGEDALRTNLNYIL